MRKIPAKSPPPAPALQLDPGWVKETRTYKLITPLLGGGVETKQADPITLVRGPSIRGQLRFWWRATRGGCYGTIPAMRTAEQALWGGPAGGSAGPSKVNLTIAVTAPGRGHTPYLQNAQGRIRFDVDNSPVPAYVAFPLQPEQSDLHPQLAEVRTGIEFTLTLTYPKVDRAAVQAALWAWETFGGLGARTRRGCGALQCTHVDGMPVIPPAQANVETWLRAELKRHVPGAAWPRGVPHVTPTMELKVVAASYVMEAWFHLIRRLRSFRQSRPGPNTHPGRSRWPEPDEIRRLTGRSCHPAHAPVHCVRKFPRAHFGLPIIFQFKTLDEPLGDPLPTTLQGGGTKSGQMASPLILRPLVCAGNKAVGLAAILEPRLGPHAWRAMGGLVLKGGPTGPVAVQADLTQGEATHIDPLDNEPDILRAFLDGL